MWVHHHLHQLLLSKDKFRLKLESINGSSNYLLVSILSNDPQADSLTSEQLERRQFMLNYDPKGAGIYVSAVIFIWGLCIALLIASTIRKNRMDKTISLYLKEIQSIRHNSDKQKILRLMPIDKSPKEKVKELLSRAISSEICEKDVHKSTLPSSINTFKLFRSKENYAKKPLIIPKICIDKDIDEDNRSGGSSESGEKFDNNSKDV